MDRADILAKVRAEVEGILGDGRDQSIQFAEDISFIDDLRMDSLDLVELVMHLEDAFNIQVEDETAKEFTTAGRAADYIAKSLEAAATP